MSSILTAQMGQGAAKGHCLGSTGKGPFLQDHTHPSAHRLPPAKM